MTIYDRIRARREKLGMSQQELAKKVGYKSRSAINKIEAGLRDISESKLEAFALALQTTPFYLMGWTDIEDTPLTPLLPIHADDDKIILSKQKTDPELLQIIDAYHELNGAGQHQLLLYAKFLYTSDEYQPAQPIRRSIAAYGGGVTELPPLDPEDE